MLHGTALSVDLTQLDRGLSTTKPRGRNMRKEKHENCEGKRPCGVPGTWEKLLSTVCLLLLDGFARFPAFLAAVLYFLPNNRPHWSSQRLSGLCAKRAANKTSFLRGANHISSGCVSQARLYGGKLVVQGS